jgi:hypothetical protein
MKRAMKFVFSWKPRSAISRALVLILVILGSVVYGE